MAKILIACEESQATTKEFRKLGHEAFSCDLLPCSGGHPEWHFQCDIFEVINQGWDLMVAHPPCTFLTGSGVQWLSHPEDKALPFEERRPHPKYPNRRNDMLDSVEFVKALYNAPIEHIAIENPVGLLSSRWRKPDQIVQPYMFGDEATKTTCLWLKNLPLLLPTEIVGKGERTVFASGKSHPKWYADALAPGLYWGYWIWQYEIEQAGLTTIPKGKIGLLSAKDGAQLPKGSILARHVDCDDYQDARAFLTNGGQRGKQVGYLNNGVYRINTHLFEMFLADITYIEDGMVGVVTALDGTPLEIGSIAGSVVSGHNNFQDFDKFLANGGQRGMQIQVIQAGSYSLNPWAIEVEKKEMTSIPIGHVGVVISYVGEEGEDTTGEGFKHGNIVKKGQKGVWASVLDPGKYAINPYTQKIEIVPTTNLVLNWATARNESHNLDKNLSTITVRSQDGFPFNLDVSQIIHVPSTEAPKVIARFGSMSNLVSQVLEPTIGNYFRNSAQDSDVISFLSTRQQRQTAAKEKISQVLEEYNVHAVDTLIGDIVPPAELMKTLTDRKIASEEEVTFETQRKAQDKRKTLESAKALADMQGQMVHAQQSVEISEREAQAAVKKSEGEAKAIELRAGANAKAKILNAEAEAKQIELTGGAEASKIEAIGKATAEAYQLQVNAMGDDNFAKLKVTEEIGKNGIKIIPEILITGGGENSPISGLLGMELLNQIQNKKQAEQ